ncbi:MAG: hypothetical protein R3B53_03370 [Candidatus Paceibacterota bacterium]
MPDLVNTNEVAKPDAALPVLEKYGLGFKSDEEITPKGIFLRMEIARTKGQEHAKQVLIHLLIALDKEVLCFHPKQ